MSVCRALIIDVVADMAEYAVILVGLTVGIGAVLGNDTNYEAALYGDFLKTAFDAKQCVKDTVDDAPLSKECIAMGSAAEKKSQVFATLDSLASGMDRAGRVVSRLKPSAPHFK